MVISRLIFLRMRKVSDKSFRENQNTHFAYYIFSQKILPFMRECEKNMLERGRPQMTVWGMRFACWIPNATNTHSEYIFIVFPRQQSLRERPSMLRSTCIACRVSFLQFSQ